MQPSSTAHQIPGDYYATDRPLRTWQHVRMRHYLREWRELRGLTQEQVAKAIGLEHKASINKIESNPEKDLSTRRVNNLTTFLRIGSEDLFRRPDPVKDLVTHTHQNGRVGDNSTDLGGPDMVNELNAWMEEASDVPPDLIPAARKLLRTLKAAVGERRHTNPTTRAKGK